MKRVYVLLFASILVLCKTPDATAQSKNFKLVRGLEIQNNILKALATEFVDTVDFEKVINTGIDAMLGSLDPYTEYLPEEDQEAIDLITTASYGGIGSVIRKVDSLGVVLTQPYYDSPAVRCGLEPGDVILKIDDIDTKPLSADECSSRMKGAPGTKVKFLVQKGRTGEIKEIEVTRDKIHVSDLSYAGILAQDTSHKSGYIKIDGFTMKGSDDVRSAVASLKEQGAERMVLDLRGNGGGLMNEAVDIVSIFVPKGTLVVSTRGRGRASTFSYVTEKEPLDTLIPLMVLVNSGSASSSEIVAGALQDLDRATIMGTRTFGKGLVQSFVPVGYGGKLKLTISRYYTPSGRCIQARDYTRRNADGSVGTIPDSLRKAFKTRLGRTVYEAGGITPDIEITGEPSSLVAYSLYVNGILDDYAIEYYKKNEHIAAPREFTLSDAEYADFVEFATPQNFDGRYATEMVFDKMITEAQSDRIYEENKELFDALEEKIKFSKEEMLTLKKEEISALLEETIVQKYYFIPGQVESILRNDSQLLDAIEKWDQPLPIETN